MPSYESWNAERAAAIISAHLALEGATLPILQALQEAFGHVPEAAVTMVAQALNLNTERSSPTSRGASRTSCATCRASPGRTPTKRKSRSRRSP